MFFYLSLLRPPPTQAPLHDSISITPQLSNDLRTESFESMQDLYYTWALVNDIPGGHSGLHRHISTKTIKLTTWRPSSAYKEIPVPIPPNVREGQRWRLVLTCQAHGSHHINPEYIDLRKSDVGSKPFSVMSMPVWFSTKVSGAGKSKKQESIERIYLLPFSIPSSNFEEEEFKTVLERRVDSLAYLKFTEKTSYDLDKKIWDSGIGLSSWVCELRENLSLSTEHQGLMDLRSVLFSDQRCRIVELGAGIGLVSVALATLRSGLRSGESPSDISDARDVILATDVSTAMPLLEQNIAANSHYFSPTRPQALVLDWEDEELPLAVKNLGGLDIVAMADVSYNTSSFPALSRVLSSLIHLGSKPPLILLGYKEREEAERMFWDMAALVGIHFEKVGERRGAGGAPVEIWLGNVEL